MCAVEHPSTPEKELLFVLYSLLHAIMSWRYSIWEHPLLQRNATSVVVGCGVR